MPAPRPIIGVIDDDESVRRALQRLLRAVGWSTLGFATAEEFLGASDTSALACLILDVHLPGLSGLELLCQLRAAGRAVPVIIITAHVDEPARELALRSGAIAFLQKPFDEQALLAATEQALA